jgi:hypothetical protein
VSEPAQPQSVEEYKAAQQAEWGQYVAAEAIDLQGARAFNAGDPVPASHVEAGTVAKSQVTRVATKTEAKAEAAKTSEK